MNYETTIGLEVHVQLATRSKAFCGCANNFGAAPNAQTCPVCLGLPGSLPVLNQAAFELAVRTALALNCQITDRIQFDRKHYFYPDLPKAFQISQYDQPLSHDGHLDIPVQEQTKRVRIHRAHLEEDAGKLLHEAGDGASLVDFNRAGVPLLEIVSEPDLASPDEAFTYLTRLKLILQYLEVSSCDMEKGTLRCDANLSVRRQGEAALGSKVEIKNLNSFRHVRAALRYEQERQVAALQSGQRIAQETRLWDAALERTRPMRSKEEASDYRYFREPDLVPFSVSPETIGRVREGLPELPESRKARLMRDDRLSSYDADLVTSSRRLADLYEATVALHRQPKAVANYLISELLAYAHVRSLEIEAVAVEPAHLAQLLQLIEAGAISRPVAKNVFVEMIESRVPPGEIVTRKGLGQISDGAALEGIIAQVIAANAQTVADVRAGKASAFQFLIGQCMKATQGKANPQRVAEQLRQSLSQQTGGS
ncbi:MAG: Asp-tRNA(Asn)/Glu-tRNA(Gln) amidotransferase subunit GatB [Candidatus Omnitrophica bacterium]|nr:Asp-tRNA(Asn)/Glu-tRNA(Gln) amidotransferase subunit GatB [Candidatus Omnitrophota bacterium]